MFKKKRLILSQELMQSRETDQKRKEDLRLEFETATQFVNAELERREQIRLAQERQDLEDRTAVRIQSWWRMVMVRKGLGQFKKKKSKLQQQASTGSRSSRK